MLDCYALDTVPALVRVVDGETCARARAVRCPRPHCNGNLLVQLERGSHIADIACLLCARIFASLPTFDLVERYGVSPEQIARAEWTSFAFLWQDADAPDTDEPSLSALRRPLHA